MHLHPRFRAALPALAVTVLLAACGDSGKANGPGGTSVSYAGTFGSSVSTGTLRFATAAPAVLPDGMAGLSAPIDLTGTLTFSDASTLTLTGTLTGTALQLDATGYSFIGTLSNGVISGTFSGPNGESGSFSATITTSGATVALYCGSFTGTDDGVFSLALKPDRTGGVIVVPTSGGGETGKARPKAGTTDQVEVLPDQVPTLVIATGLLAPISGTSFDSIDGLWDDSNGGSGTFGGSTRCQ